MGRQHSIAKRPTTSLAELASLPMISFPKDPASSYATHVMSMLHAAGAHPTVGHEAIEIHTALSLVAAGLGYAIVGGSVATRGPSDVAFVGLPEIAPHTYVLAVTREDDEICVSGLTSGASVRIVLRAADVIDRHIQIVRQEVRAIGLVTSPYLLDLVVCH